MRRQMLGIVGAAIAVSLTVPGSALARAGDRSFADTYPVASALCLRAAAQPATLGRRLEPNAAKVVAACQTLDNPFLSLVSTVDAAEATLLNTISAQKLLVATACPRPVPASENTYRPERGRVRVPVHDTWAPVQFAGTWMLVAPAAVGSRSARRVARLRALRAGSA